MLRQSPLGARVSGQRLQTLELDIINCIHGHVLLLVDDFSHRVFDAVRA